MLGTSAGASMMYLMAWMYLGSQADHNKNSPLELIVNPYYNNSLYGKTIQKIVFGLPGTMKHEKA